MACPLFIPVAPMSGIASEPSTLGELYGGTCSADPTFEIPGEILRGCCNSGYARTKCVRAGQAGADAVRFLIKQRNFKGLEIAWSLENDHHPVATGTLYLSSVGEPQDPGIGSVSVLERQACAYAKSMLR